MNGPGATKPTKRDDRRVAVVTGGGSGIGRACALAFDKAGYGVAILGRRSEALAAVATDEILAFRCDVADRAQVDRTAKAIAAQFGHIDVLLNAAGVFPRAPAEEASPELVARVIGINLIGTINCCAAFAPHLVAAHGSIINISSRLAHQATSGVSLYAASKGGVESYSRALAVELGQRGKVRVNVICPGLVETEMLRGMPNADAVIADRKKYYPLGRLGQPSDIAAIVSFLASAESSWLTGALIAVDGGASAYGGS
jgi:NAD(P)-dependent dehydrogenase (short-subunit alcohol dehydrogenase family)